MGITDQCNTKAGKEPETGQISVQLASTASLATLKIGLSYHPKPAESERSCP